METHYKYILVGGVTAVYAAQYIREIDTVGNILLVGDEPHPPYDRPPLSKQMLAKDEYPADDAYSKYDDFYPKNHVELRRAIRVTAVDRAAKTVSTDDGHTYTYDKLLLATGSRAKSLDVPGANRTGVFVLRTIEHSFAIRQALQNSRKIVVIGSGYIGTEIASDAQRRGLDVEIIEHKGHAWPRFASEKLGTFIQGYFEGKGAKFHANSEVASIDGDSDTGPVRGVTLKDGTKIAADAVVVAVGAVLNTELGLAAGLDGDPANGYFTDEFLHTSDPNIWAAGDVACFQDLALGKKWHVEHHLNAKWQGQAVGKILAGGEDPFDRVPYFWTDFLDLHMILRGDSEGGKSAAVIGDMASGEFTELYADAEGRLVMGISISRDEPSLDPISDKLEELIRARVQIASRKAEIEAEGFKLEGLG